MDAYGTLNGSFKIDDSQRQSRVRSFPFRVILLSLAVLLSLVSLVYVNHTAPSGAATCEPFFSNISTSQHICPSADGKAVSHAGYIGLKGDTAKRPKRSFFWYFEAQTNAADAPIILTIGGGPGVTGMGGPMTGQSHCALTENGTVPVSHGWTERFNLLALDHPIGVGYSYGTRVNNSHAAAVDVYDFLQKFFRTYPNLTKNEFVISGGSYGGVYVPHIATIIHQQNLAIRAGRGETGAVHINLKSLMISNPYTDVISHFRWVLHQRCYNHQLYNSTTCRDLYAVLPDCLEGLELALTTSSTQRKVSSNNICVALERGDTHGTLPEDMRQKCNKSGLGCHPHFGLMEHFFWTPSIMEALSVPPHVNFTSISDNVAKEFEAAGDPVQRAHLLYEPLLEDGIRVLHYVGAQDANCGWPGILSFLKFIRSPFQDAFIQASDVPWPSQEEGTVRVVGEGAGQFTYILVSQAGHFVKRDQPALVKRIVEHWIDNTSFFE